MLASGVIAAPALAASGGSQQPQSTQMQPTQTQNSGQQNSSGQSAQNAPNNQPIPPQKLSSTEVKQVQQALDKDGFRAGRTDGRWGPETRVALEKFQQSKQIQSNGRLNQQTIADLGLNTSEFSQNQKTK
ncbi:peptidoglycan-binding domain-containing protein [Bradyrhizobium sp.]|uniref:peptidoglycan-binding domain-containing protein n=1 Tax=Bradyrhizobium sp. TaxID=376 RepID=UPI003C52D59D